MKSDFQTEMQSWQAVLFLRKWTVTFFSTIVVVLISLFFVAVWEYQILSTQISQLTNQVEIIAELDESLGQEQISNLQQEIQNSSSVAAVDYWPVERSAKYIDEKIMSGYSDFLRKTQSQIPVRPLFRIQLHELAQKKAFESMLTERYGHQLYLVDSLVQQDGQSFAQQFIQSITHSARIFQISLVLLFLLSLGLYAYLISFILSERSKGFHLTQALHLSPPYQFFPALVMSIGLSALLSFLGCLLAFFFLQHFLVSLMISLFFAFVFVDLILVWFGRYVTIRWSLR